jgi:rRNA maturation RNase YbeY
MIKVDVVKEVRCPVSAKKIKNIVSETFEKNGIVSDTVTSVTFVGEEKMEVLAKKYMEEKGKEAKNHPVLSFVNSEISGQFSFPPDGKIYIGEIVINWDFVLREAKSKGKLLDKVSEELAEHGAMHLLGIHHN